MFQKSMFPSANKMFYVLEVECGSQVSQKVHFTKYHYVSYSILSSWVRILTQLLNLLHFKRRVFRRIQTKMLCQSLHRICRPERMCKMKTESLIPAFQHEVQGNSSEVHCTEFQLELHHLVEASIFASAQKEKKSPVALSTKAYMAEHL